MANSKNKDESVEDKMERIQQAFLNVSETEDGRLALRWLLFITGYEKELIIQDPISLEVNTGATMYNLSKRDFWLRIRQLLTPTQLAKIENQGDI